MAERTSSTWDQQLTDAFEVMEERGLVARQDHLCCKTCAADDLNHIVDTRREKGEHILGYAYYHNQDADGIRDGRGVYIGFSSAVERETTMIQKAIGRLVCQCLKEAGFSPVWEDDPEQRIFIPPEEKN